jgi:hypothetical protein
LPYGEKNAGPIPTNALLAFDVELLKFLPQSVIEQYQLGVVAGVGVSTVDVCGECLGYGWSGCDLMISSNVPEDTQTKKWRPESRHFLTQIANSLIAVRIVVVISDDDDASDNRGNSQNRNDDPATGKFILLRSRRADASRISNRKAGCRVGRRSKGRCSNHRNGGGNQERFFETHVQLPFERHQANWHERHDKATFERLFKILKEHARDPPVAYSCGLT